MIVLKSTYDKLFDLFIEEKQGALELYQRNQQLLTEKLNIIDDMLRLKIENERLRATVRNLNGWK